MTTPLRQRIRRSIENPALQAALDANAERRLRVRQEAFASLKDPDAVRRQAKAVRAETIAHLERHVEKFAAKAASNGMIVHRAASASEAVQTVLEIARKHGAKLISKSKTMLGEEIELNQALEAVGLKVVETDLGEYIVQLRGEPPAHIITPAVHLRRAEVGETFHEKLGIPLTEDIPTLTTAARKALREVFLSTEIGISGVNFGVVETGTLCVLTNEGNGRMVTTVPPVHIALMGIERLVPTLDDLALMIALLPRSATGQKITVYTSLIHSPRREDEPDAPLERHLVLVDYGRLALSKTPLAEILTCIRCGACLNACPVFREICGHAYIGASGKHTPYPGPLGSVISPGLLGQAEFGNLARASSLCGACKEACPVDIDLPRLLLRVRAGGMVPPAPAPDRHVPWYLKTGLKLFAAAATRPRLYRLCQSLLGIASRTAAPASPWLRLPAFTGWGYSKDFPRPVVRTFSRLMSSEESAGNGEEKVTRDQLPVIRGEPVSSEKSTVTGIQLPLNGEKPSAALFAEELEAVGGKVIRCGREELSDRVIRELMERGAGSVLAWEREHLHAGLVEALEAAGIQVTHTPDPAAAAGLTAALGAAAETGSLLVAAGKGTPLSASLLPEIHLAVLSEDQIVPTLADLLNVPAVRNASAAALITGPSRTADIEMTLTIGVHGPAELIVFLLPAA